MKKKVIAIGAGGIALSAALLSQYWGAWAAPEIAATKSAPPLPVSLAQAVRRDLPVRLEAVGNVQPFHTVSVRPQVDGQLQQVLFSEGQPVHAGDLLAVIDPRLYQASLAQAEARRAQDQAQLETAKRDLDRANSLAAKEFVSAQAVDAAQSKVRQLEAAVKADSASIETAHIQLGYTSIRSPIDGRAGFRQIDPGNIVHGSGFDSGSRSGGGGSSGGSSDSLVTITQLQPIAVTFTLPQDSLSQILGSPQRRGADVFIYGKDGRQLLEQGSLDSIDNAVDIASGTVKLKARLANKDEQLWPGQYVTVRIEIGQHPQALTLPAAAIVKSAEGELVFAAKPDGTVEARPVTTGLSDGDSVEILSGVSEGESVVTSGQYRLRSGSRIAAKG